jgi:DNA-binding winged helix-turn-helix (wHTH) protein
MGNKSFTFRFAGVEVREREFSLVEGGEFLPVEPKEFRVLPIFPRNPQELFRSEEFFFTA